MINPKSDAPIQTDLPGELTRHPEGTDSFIDGAVKDGQGTLQGTAELYREKWAAARDALQMNGTHLLTDDTSTLPAKNKTYLDTDIEHQVVAALLFEWLVPNNRIQAKVRDGWVTLHGTTDWQYQCSAAEAVAQRITGVRGVLNKITVVPQYDGVNAYNQLR